MQRYIATRLLLFIPTILLVTLVVFLLMRVMPGDPALLILAGTEGDGSYTQEELAALRHTLGTGRALHIQYLDWIWDMLHGDLGTSSWYGVEIQKLLEKRLPLTLELAAIATLLSFMVAVPLGVLSALFQDTIPDYIARIFSFTGIAIPTFLTGMIVVYLLVRLFNWFPPLDYTPPWEDLGTNFSRLIFPALALSFYQMAFIARVTRSSMLEVMREDYIRTARSKGVRENRVIFVHALQNAFLPILTVTGWSFGVVLGGTVIIETIFVLPGMGTLMIDSIFHRDYFVIQALVLLVAGMVLLLNLVIDLFYGLVDPRIRFR